MGEVMIVKQIPVGNLSVFSYLAGCEKTKEAMVIDPGGDHDKIMAEAGKLGLNIKYIFNTHHHFDHVLSNADFLLYANRLNARLSLLYVLL